MSPKRRCTMLRVWVKFIWGKMIDCSQGGSASDSSERLLQRGSGRKVNTWGVGEGGVQYLKHSFYKRFSASSRGSDVTVKGFSAFLGMRGRKDWDYNVPRNHRHSHHSALNSLGLLKVSSCSSTGFSLCRGRRQVPLLSCWQCNW